MELKPFGPLQLYVTPEVKELPLSVTDVAAQVSVPPTAEAPGAVVFSETVADAVLVHPFPPVAVRVYVPAAEVVGFCCVEENPFGPDHAKVALPFGELAFRVTVVTVHVNVPPTAEAPGTATSCTTVAVVEAVQPLAGLVTVTV